MKQPGLGGRHRDQNGQIELKHGNTLNRNLPSPIPGFGPNMTLSKMRKKTGEVSEKDIRAAVAKSKK